MVSVWSVRPPERGHSTNYRHVVPQVRALSTIQDRTPKAGVGSSNHDVAVVTYVSDYEDPAIPDAQGRLTEVNRFTLTRGGTFTATTTFHDFFGDVRIFVRYHLTEVNGTVRVEREVVHVTGCA